MIGKLMASLFSNIKVFLLNIHATILLQMKQSFARPMFRFCMLCNPIVNTFFLYELYKSWFRKNSPSGTIQGKNKFISEIINITKNSDTWYCIDKSKNIRSAGKMIGPEPLIAEYDLVEWKNQNYAGGNLDRTCTPTLKDFYRGLLRYNTSDSTDDTIENASIGGVTDDIN